jgi:hypothetical protein
MTLNGFSTERMDRVECAAEALSERAIDCWDYAEIADVVLKAVGL